MIHIFFHAHTQNQPRAFFALYRVQQTVHVQANRWDAGTNERLAKRSYMLSKQWSGEV